MVFKHRGFANGFKMSQDDMFVFDEKKKEQQKKLRIKKPKTAVQMIQETLAFISMNSYSMGRRRRTKKWQHQQ
jgi:hypothetical protein